MRAPSGLFIGSLDFAIKAARHFDYAWPIQFKVDSFDVIVEARNDDGLGQTDVGGIYAYVMVQAYELTGEQRYLHEARKAIDAAKDMRFELNYQANLTAWGAAACMRLWRITDDEYYLRQSYVYLASFFHNCVIWESEIAQRRATIKVFLGATCLHDAPYMAIFECFDSFAAFERYLKDSGPDLDPAARLLVSEYCKYALDRAWFYYPDALPAGRAGEGRNPQRPYRPHALLPGRGSLRRRPARGPGRPGNLRRRRGVRVCQPLVPRRRGRAVPDLLRPFSGHQRTHLRAIAELRHRWRQRAAVLVQRGPASPANAFPA